MLTLIDYRARCFRRSGRCSARSVRGTIFRRNCAWCFC